MHLLDKPKTSFRSVHIFVFIHRDTELACLSHL